ncbi:hypothetical protein AOC10_06210 [Polynucleobacter asymbioticus]|uniref:hypothetical protein n=1 Tax=Polynucleobacter asymbioticus TaxID=576611 RepID=UPI0008FADC9C|nr:hypothetical protein [Polynucleobacter asymbioticus]APC06143.1 hypothetical protein AOC10_06210 [Polynucleobacter asymbioticus]
MITAYIIDACQIKKVDDREALIQTLHDMESFDWRSSIDSAKYAKFHCQNLCIPFFAGSPQNITITNVSDLMQIIEQQDFAKVVAFTSARLDCWLTDRFSVRIKTAVPNLILYSQKDGG